MRVHTKLVYELRGNEYVLVLEEGFEYSGPVASCKGDEVAKQGEKSSLSFAKTLQGAFSTQFGNQQSVLSQLRSAVTGHMDEGFGAPKLAAMRSGATENTAMAVKNAQVANNNAMAVHGASGLPSGVSEQITADTNNAGAMAQDQAQNQITQADADQQQKNFWNGAGALEGVASQYNPNGVASEANGAASDIAGLSNAYSNSQSAGAWNHFTNSFGSALGDTLGGGNVKSLASGTGG